MKNIKNITYITAILIAGVAAFFSITGLSKLFAGALIPVIIMGSVLEFGKIIGASHLQRNWKNLAHGFRIYLTIVIIVLMGITSMGIYGFLTSAYQETAHKFDNIQKQTEIIDKKENLVKDQIKRDEDFIKTRTEREKTLTSLRAAQETRIDTLINRNRNSYTKAAQASIGDANEEIKQINLEVGKYNTEINVLNDSVNVFENQKMQLSNSNAVAEIGPLKYISNLTGKPMDVVVNWIILALIFVFDPFAIMLLISAQSIKETEEKKENEVQELINNSKEEELENTKEEETEEEFVKYEPKNETAIDMPEIFEKSNDEFIIVGDPPLPHITEGQEAPLTGYTFSFSAKSPFIMIEEEKKDENFEKYYQEQLDSISKYEIKFNELIDVLYNNGTVKTGENLLNYLEFKDRVERKFAKKFDADDIKKFLVICNYLKVTSLSGGERKALLNFSEAKAELKRYFNE